MFFIKFSEISQRTIRATYTMLIRVVNCTLVHILYNFWVILHFYGNIGYVRDGRKLCLFYFSIKDFRHCDNCFTRNFKRICFPTPTSLHIFTFYIRIVNFYVIYLNYILNYNFLRRICSNQIWLQDLAFWLYDLCRRSVFLVFGFDGFSLFIIGCVLLFPKFFRINFSVNVWLLVTLSYKL